MLPVLSTSTQRSRPRDVLLSSASANAGFVGDGGGDCEEDHAGSVGSDKLVKYFRVKMAMARDNHYYSDSPVFYKKL